MNKKQVKYLKTVAQKTPVSIQFGKNNFTASQLKTLQENLDAREIVKVKILDNSELDTKILNDKVKSSDPSIKTIMQIGNTITFYRQSKKTENRRISLQIQEIG